MAADQTLVQGAYNASRYYGQPVDEARNRLLNNLNKFGETVDNSIGKEQLAQQENIEQQKKQEKKQQDAIDRNLAKEREAREKVWNKNASKLIAADGSMSSQDYGAATDAVANVLKPQFLDGDPTQQNMAMNDLALAAKEINGVKDYRLENATFFANANTPGQAFNEDGYSLALQDDEEALTILGNHSSDSSLSISPTTNDAGEQTGIQFGVLGFNGQHMSLDDADALSESFKVDVESKSNILALQNEMADQAENGTHEDTFNLREAKERITDIVKNGKQKSLMYDPLIKSSSFKDDLYSSGMLSKVTYADLGLSEEDISKLDKDGDGKANEQLSPEDQNSIIKMFIGSPNLQQERQDMLIDYYTQSVRQAWQTKHQEHVDLYNRNNPNTGQSSVVTDPNAPAGFMQGGMVTNIGGGQVSADGVYTPGK